MQMARAVAAIALQWRSLGRHTFNYGPRPAEKAVDPSRRPAGDCPFWAAKFPEESGDARLAGSYRAACATPRDSRAPLSFFVISAAVARASARGAKNEIAIDAVFLLDPRLDKRGWRYVCMTLEMGLLKDLIDFKSGKVWGVLCINWLMVHVFSSNNMKLLHTNQQKSFGFII